MSRIVGPGLEPGAQHERDSVVVDTRGAVLLENVHTCTVETATQGRAIALELEGKVNRSSARSDVLYLMDQTGAAKLVADIIGLAARAGDSKPFMAAVSFHLGTQL